MHPLIRLGRYSKVVGVGVRALEGAHVTRPSPNSATRRTPTSFHLQFSTTNPPPKRPHLFPPLLVQFSGIVPSRSTTPLHSQSHYHRRSTLPGTTQPHTSTSLSLHRQPCTGPQLTSTPDHDDHDGEHLALLRLTLEFRLTLPYVASSDYDHITSHLRFAFADGPEPPT